MVPGAALPLPSAAETPGPGYQPTPLYTKCIGGAGDGLRPESYSIKIFWHRFIRYKLAAKKGFTGRAVLTKYGRVPLEFPPLSRRFFAVSVLLETICAGIFKFRAKEAEKRISDVSNRGITKFPGRAQYLPKKEISCNPAPRGKRPNFFLLYFYRFSPAIYNKQKQH
jgi:hypothetical protein